MELHAIKYALDEINRLLQQKNLETELIEIFDLYQQRNELLIDYLSQAIGQMDRQELRGYLIAIRESDQVRMYEIGRLQQELQSGLSNFANLKKYLQFI